MPTSALPNSTPFEALYGKKPDVSLFRVFGSLAYVHIQKDKRKGLSPHMEKAVFIGYPTQYKGWEFYNTVTKKFIKSDRADFDERICPGTTGYLPDQVPIPLPPTPTPPPTGPDDFHIPDVPDQVGDEPHEVGDDQAPLDTPSNSPPPSHNSTSNSTPVPTPTPIPTPEPQPRRSKRLTKRQRSPTPTPTPSPSPSSEPQPEPEQRKSDRIKTNPTDWKNNWYKSDYRPLAKRQRMQEPEYRDPTPSDS